MLAAVAAAAVMEGMEPAAMAEAAMAVLMVQMEQLILAAVAGDVRGTEQHLLVGPVL